MSDLPLPSHSERPVPGTMEYGVRTFGGHVEVSVSRHVAQREVEERQANGDKNVWLVKRRVEDWQRVIPPAVD